MSDLVWLPIVVIVAIVVGVWMVSQAAMLSNAVGHASRRLRRGRRTRA